MVASWLLWTKRAEQVWLVPVYRHAFEGMHGKTLADYADRVAWCQALARDVDARIAVSDVESQLPVPSYTIDTLRYLAAAHPQHHFQLVVGADVIPDLPQWRDWSRIERDFSPIIVGRGGYPAPPDAPVFPEVSSSDIRDRLARGRPVDHLLTAQVAAALQAHRSGSPTK